MKTLEYNSKRLAKRIQALMKESSNVIVSPNTSKNVPKMQEIDEQEAYKQEVHKHPVLLTRQVIDFLKVRYDFRYNLLTEETEFRPSGQREIPFCRIDKRELNTFCLEAHKEGINCWDKDLQRYIYSTLVESYHPFRLYMNELPAWDGTDRLKPLAKRVSDTPIWIKSFHTWMLGLAAQCPASTSAKPIRKISGRCLVSPLSSEQVTGLTYCAIRQAAADSSALKRSMILTVPELNIHKSTPN